ncbi:MBL fold metallo-hydrolase [Haliovirga abyssi]|uniref:MBL fold hydrolase n=1 Tax=Haliovirga abyssi TaxID=2996794 RepID=A0AAU9DVV6_9FUSO|nr:MBL fold metallo-hydrolase [Haliovirga abyssi]BDU50356.1 MBL fold hydrolase [Haliovirga abyssi]
MEVTVLMENLVYKQGLKSEHGLSFLLKSDDLKIIFDTGQTGDFICNAIALGENLKNVDYVVLSHGHYDHTGGLKRFLDINKTAKIIMKKEALEEKYSNSTGKIRPIGFELKDSYMNYDNEFIFVDGFYDINKNIRVIGDIKKYTDYEDDEKKLFIKKDEEFIKDSFKDELFLVEKNDNNKKIDIITGCSHNGIINIIKTAKYNFEDYKINSVIGGTHLKGKSSDRIEKTIKALEKLEINKIGVNHCTGIDSYTILKSKLGDNIFYAYTGLKINL